MKSYLRNFHGFFPDGFYRQTEPLNYAQKDPFVKKVIEELDARLAQNNFDLQRYQRIVKIVQHYTHKGYALLDTRAGLSTAMHYLNRADTFTKARNEMIAQYYELLVALGYDAEKLKG